MALSLSLGISDLKLDGHHHRQDHPSLSPSYLSPSSSSTLSLSSFSSSSTFSDVSPLPSPAIHPHPMPAPPAAGSKTSSFFGSPWSSAGPSPLLRPTSLHSPKQDHLDSDDSDEPRSPSPTRSTAATPTAPKEDDSKPPSLTDDFFASSPTPAPAPALALPPLTNASVAASPPPKVTLEPSPSPRLAPLLRLFGARPRYGTAPAPLDLDSAVLGLELEKEPTPTVAHGRLSPNLDDNPSEKKRRKDKYAFFPPPMVPSPTGVEFERTRRIVSSPVTADRNTSLRAEHEPVTPALIVPNPTPTLAPTPTSCVQRERNFSVSTRTPPVASGSTPTTPSSPRVDTPAESETRPGSVLTDSKTGTRLTLQSPLGQGAFSSVWLARGHVGLSPHAHAHALGTPTTASRAGSRTGSLRRKPVLDGTCPQFNSHSARMRLGSGKEGSEGSESIYLDAHDGDGDGVVQWPRERERTRSETDGVDWDEDGGRVVALKMTDRTGPDTNDRTRVSFVREVEVLRHISHPSIVAYLGSFTTPAHYCLALEHVGGGELFELINSDARHALVTEPVLRRIWGELSKAVGWMHGVGLVHRDIKLENILLTRSPTDPSAHPHRPLVKLTDFGLARFIDPASPLLQTRCGSESYAAPELVLGKRYDGRETDAWACGVVLYALVCRRLPFEGENAGAGAPQSVRSGTSADNRGSSPKSRRAFLLRIAQGEYDWPESASPPQTDEQDQEHSEEPTGTALAHISGVRRIVDRLLVRDPAKRSRMVDLWQEEWMQGEGAPLPPLAVIAAGEEGLGAVSMSRRGSRLSRKGSARRGRHATAPAEVGSGSGSGSGEGRERERERGREEGRVNDCNKGDSLFLPTHGSSALPVNVQDRALADANAADINGVKSGGASENGDGEQAPAPALTQSPTAEEFDPNFRAVSPDQESSMSVDPEPEVDGEVDMDADETETDGEDADDDGLLVDAEAIDNIARTELQ